MIYIVGLVCLMVGASLGIVTIALLKINDGEDDDDAGT